MIMSAIMWKHGDAKTFGENNLLSRYHRETFTKPSLHLGEHIDFLIWTFRSTIDTERERERKKERKKDRKRERERETVSKRERTKDPTYSPKIDHLSGRGCCKSCAFF